MVLTFEQAVELIKNPKCKGKIDLSRDESKTYNMHVNGIGFIDSLAKIDGYENAEQLKLRKKLSRSNRETFSKLLRPVDKIFSAKGGSKLIDLPDTQKKEFLSTKYKGYSLRDWIENNINKYYVDPNGLFFVEVNSKGEVYPTYKSIRDIYDYYINGLIVEYVIFEPYEKKEDQGALYYRVVDDNRDIVIREKGEDYTEVEGEEYANEYGKVPAVLISSLPDNVYPIMQSPIKVSVETAKEFMQNNSTKTIYKYLHLYPIFWRYLEDCPTCQGTGQKDGKNCAICGGSGLKKTKDVSDVIGLPQPQDANDATIAPNVAGYVQPDLETLREIRTELKDLYDEMEFGLYGSNTKEDSGNETATGRWIDTQPVFDALKKYSDWAERVEKELTDIIATIKYGSNYKGSSIKYGRRYMIEPPDVIFDKYLKAKEKGAPKAVLDLYLMQYYQTLFENDALHLAKMMRKIELEPFVHHSDSEVLGLEVLEIDYYKKVYYDDWEKTIKDNDLITLSLDVLNTSLTDYANNKLSEKKVNINQNQTE